MKWTGKFLAALRQLIQQARGRSANRVRQRSASPPPGPAAQRRGPWLDDWRQAQRVPVMVAVHPVAQRLILAAARHEMLQLRYCGGSTPGRERSFSPQLVFQLDGCGPLYVAGFCHLRRAERVLHVGRLELLDVEASIICVTE